MFIVMHCGGMPFSPKTLEYKSLGGSESAAFYLSRELARRGHKVTLFTNSPEEQESADGVNYRYAGQVTEQTPLGDRYHTYAVATPHDLNITQRHPAAFQIPVASKLKAWWLHDMPIEQLKMQALGNMLRADVIFCVSEWHKRQIVNSWGIKAERVFNVTNGVDLDVFEQVEVINGHPAVGQRIAALSAQMEPDGDKFRLIYSSRPERGLESLVKPGGIMERLHKVAPNVVLYVCGYDNVTAHMADYYRWLWARCAELPNVCNLGPLTKSELAGVMRGCHLLAYPTVFSETSCITAMEAQAAGLPMLSSHVGALPETCENSGSVLLPLEHNPEHMPGAMEAGDHSQRVNLDGFVRAVLQFMQAPNSERKRLKEAQLSAAELQGWGRTADRVEAAAAQLFETSPTAICRGLMRDSDIYALREYMAGAHPDTVDGIMQATANELRECYGFVDLDDWGPHYAAYYQYEADRGVDYGPESLDGNHRFELVLSIVAHLPAGSRVLDYGCAHGHYTVNLARRFPALKFVGVDIAASNVEKARAWAESEGLANVSFEIGQLREVTEPSAHLEIDHEDGTLSGLMPDPIYDCIIAAEVLEHVAEPGRYIDTLAQYLTNNGLFIVTTPYGPWEASGYNDHWPWRAHVHHLERQDLHELWGHNPGFSITIVSAGRGLGFEPIGSYVTKFGKPAAPSGAIDYRRKLRQLAPRQTLSVCMIVKDAESTLRRTLESVAGIADEFIVRIDSGTTDRTQAVLRDALEDLAPHVSATVFDGAPVVEVGFDEARNDTLAKASGDWILWIDADEILDGGELLVPYLRASMYDAYGVAHHHFSAQPAGILKTDYPARIFRNGKGFRFFGVVHEHPEAELNKGIDFTAVIKDVAVVHQGYTNEAVRRGRFARNFPLLQRDREKYPERTLGKFLYLRDLFQSIRYELEQQPLVTPRMVAQAAEGIALWYDLVQAKNARLSTESLEWYSGCVELAGGGKALEVSVNGHAVKGIFKTREHADALIALLVDGS